MSITTTQMRKTILRCGYLLLLCLVFSAVSKSQIQKLYIDPKSAGSEKQSRYIDSINFIPLEVKDGIELGDYISIEVTEGYFLLINHLEKSILMYLRNGAFVKKIKFGKLGDNFYPVYHERRNQIVFFGSNKNYSLTRMDQIEIMMDLRNPRSKKYFKKYFIDLSNTSLVIKKDVPNENDLTRSYHLYDDFYWQGRIFTSPRFTDSLDYEGKIYKGNQLVKAFFPYNRVNDPRFLYSEGACVFNRTDTSYINFVSRPYCDTIYKMLGDSLYPAFHVVFPLENTLPPTFFTRPFKNKTEWDNFMQNNGWMFRQVYNFYETTHFFILTVGYLSNHDTYIYNKAANTTYKVKNIKPDSTQFNLSLLEGNSKMRGNRFYKPLKAGDLIAFREQYKHIQLPKGLEDFLQSKPDRNSPIIVEYKFKTGQ